MSGTRATEGLGESLRLRYVRMCQHTTRSLRKSLSCASPVSVLTALRTRHIKPAQSSSAYRQSQYEYEYDYQYP
eukprot:scaffold60373_cov29-Prasinocladus_malaysianus.AAC.1